MPAKSISLPGLPLIDDGHQFRVEAATGLGACETAIRLLLIDEASVVVEGRLRGRLDPPVLAVLPRADSRRPQRLIGNAAPGLPAPNLQLGQ